MEEFFADRLFNALEREPVVPGSLLVSAPDTRFGDLARSVVLVLAHNEELTFGVDLAARSDVAVFNVLPDWHEVVSKPQALYIGGPLSQQTVVGVGVTAPGVEIDKYPFLTQLVGRIVHIDLNVDPEQLRGLVEGVRLFAGYAGWSPGQLEEEIEAGDWYVVPALNSDVVAPGGRDVWGDVLRRQPLPLPLFATFPADLADN